MPTTITLLPDGYIHVLNNDKSPNAAHPKHQVLIMQGKGRYDAVTGTVFLEYRKQLIPVPICGEFNVQDFRE